MSNIFTIMMFLHVCIEVAKCRYVKTVVLIIAKNVYFCIV